MPREPRPGTPQFSQTDEGREVFIQTTRWVHRRMGNRGMRQYLTGHKNMRDFGLSKDNAIKELKPLIPNAHDSYNEHGDSRQSYETWEAFYVRYLANRIHHWFKGTNPRTGQKKARTLIHGEWPGEKRPFRPL